MILEDRTLVVSGVGSGLGREVARLALRDGARVMLAARTESVLERTAAELDPSGERAGWCRADITRPEDGEALVAAAEKRFGGVDALVQVAAYENVFGGLEDTDFENWRRAFDTNVIGSLTLIRAAAAAMERHGGGAVVLIGSQAQYLPQLPQAGYAASKAALASAMLYLTQELGPRGIRVNMVAPSWMWGPPVEAFVKFRARSEDRPEESVVDEIRSRIPLGEIVPDEEVAEAVVFLASQRARCISGQVLAVNGGEWMR